MCFTDCVDTAMGLLFQRFVYPLWAIFCALCLLIFRSYQIVDQNLMCNNDVEDGNAFADLSRQAKKTPKLLHPAVNSTFPFHPFEEGQPKLVVILTYQRCGSTFFGQLFNENPDAFYMFEPLDSLYSAIYGTRQGGNSLSDITSYRNGSERILPDEEIKMVSQFLLSLLSCDVDSLPTETLVNRFFAQFSSDTPSMKQYMQCVTQIRLLSSTCTANSLSDYCGNRFGEKSEEVLMDCRRTMTDANYRRTQQHRPIFAEYFKCRSHLRELLNKKCALIWQTTCSTRSLRAVKVVRGTMDSMEPLLQAIPNLRVIHLIRDPRGVALSRKRFYSHVRGMFTELDPNQTMSREAYLYCRTVVRDVRRRKELEVIYPGKIFPVIYDDVVGNIKGYIEDVYRFIGMSSVPESVWSYYRRSNYPVHYADRLDSIAIANQWQDVLSVRENKKIEAVCKEFFQVIN